MHSVYTASFNNWAMCINEFFLSSLSGATLTEHKISMVFRYENCMVKEATTTAPVTDFLQGVHDSLFSKLFYS